MKLCFVAARENLQIVWCVNWRTNRKVLLQKFYSCKFAILRVNFGGEN